MPQEPESVCKGGGKSESQPDPEVDVVGSLVEKSTLAVSLSGMATLKMCPGCIRKPSIICPVGVLSTLCTQVLSATVDWDSGCHMVGNAA